MLRSTPGNSKRNGDTETGSFTFSAIGAGLTSSTVEIPHTLNSDNITFEAVVRGGSFNFGNASFRVIAQFMRPDGACDVFGHADPGIAPYPLIIFTPPAKTFSLVVTSNATVTQDVIVDYKLTRLN